MRFLVHNNVEKLFSIHRSLYFVSKTYQSHQFLSYTGRNLKCHLTDVCQVTYSLPSPNYAHRSDKNWLGYVLEQNEEIDELMITFLHSCGPATSFSYPINVDVLKVPVVDVLTKVDLVPSTGRTFMFL